MTAVRLSCDLYDSAAVTVGDGRRRMKAKFHYTDTDFFAAKRTRTDPTEFRRKKVRVRVRVVEFSYKQT